MRRAFLPSLPLSLAALLNALSIRYGGAPVVEQAANHAFLRAILDLATAQTIMRMAKSPPLASVARWFLAVEEEYAELARHLWERYLCPRYPQAERDQLRQELATARGEKPAQEDPAVRRARWRRLRASLSLDELEVGAPFFLAPGARGALREQMVQHGLLEVVFSMWIAGFFTNEQLRRYAEVLWRDSAARRRRLRALRRRRTLLEWLATFVYQTELARREADDAPLTEAAWACLVWDYLDRAEQTNPWIRQRLREYVPAGSLRRLPVARLPIDDLPRALAADPGPMVERLRQGLIEFFQLAAPLARYAEQDSLTNEELHRVARVEILLLSLAPDAAPLLPAAAYARPLLEAVREARGRLAAAPQATTAAGRHAADVLARLEAYYHEYQAWGDPLPLRRLGRFPADAVRLWGELLRGLAEQGVVYFAQRTVQLQLRRALGVAITPRQSRLSRHLLASPDLLRACESARIGVSRRARGDMFTEVAIYLAKLRARVVPVRRLLSSAAWPPNVREPGERLAQAAFELAEQVSQFLQGREHSSKLSSCITGGYDTKIKPAYAEFEVAWRRFSAPGDGDFPYSISAARREALGEAARRLAWTAEDMAAFFRQRDLGLRWLLRNRDDDRWDDVFSRDSTRCEPP